MKKEDYYRKKYNELQKKDSDNEQLSGCVALICVFIFFICIVAIS